MENMILAFFFSQLDYNSSLETFAITAHAEWCSETFLKPWHPISFQMLRFVFKSNHNYISELLNSAGPQIIREAGADTKHTESAFSDQAAFCTDSIYIHIYVLASI